MQFEFEIYTHLLTGSLNCLAFRITLSFRVLFHQLISKKWSWKKQHPSITTKSKKAHAKVGENGTANVKLKRKIPRVIHQTSWVLLPPAYLLSPQYLCAISNPLLPFSDYKHSPLSQWFGTPRSNTHKIIQYNIYHQRE